MLASARAGHDKLQPEHERELRRRVSGQQNPAGQHQQPRAADKADDRFAAEFVEPMTSNTGCSRAEEGNGTDQENFPSGMPHCVLRNATVTRHAAVGDDQPTTVRSNLKTAMPDHGSHGTHGFRIARSSGSWARRESFQKTSAHAAISALKANSTENCHGWVSPRGQGRDQERHKAGDVLHRGVAAR